MKAAELAPGAIGLIPFPNNDGTTEARPVLVLKIGPLGPSEDVVVLIAEITADEARVAAPRAGDYVLSDWEEAGLYWPSVIRCRQLRSLSPDLIYAVIGHVGPGTLLESQERARVLMP